MRFTSGFLALCYGFACWGLLSVIPDIPAHAGDGVLSEVRAGVLAHDVGPFAAKEEDGIDYNAEVLFLKPKEHVLIPRPHAGFALNSAGDTNRLYGGFTWDFTSEKRMFLEVGVGAVYHDGVTAPSFSAETEGRKTLGCSVLIRGSLSLGYNITERHNLSVLVDHMSNAGICQANEGSDSVGLRYGYRFKPIHLIK